MKVKSKVEVVFGRYSFQTPEAWDVDDRYRSIGYMRPMAIWAMQWALMSKKPTKIPTKALSKMEETAFATQHAAFLKVASVLKLPSKDAAHRSLMEAAYDFICKRSA